MPGGFGRFSVRTERALVRVLLALRRETRVSPAPEHDERRAHALADLILSDFPRRVIPFGIAALVVIVLTCATPLVRDLAAEHGVAPGTTCAASVVESGLRGRTAEVSDGFDALRAVVAPFSATTDGADSTGDSGHERPVLPKDAAAPFKRS